jgi:hypothetical protein
MGKIREYVINVYNDLDYSKIDYLTSSNQHSRERLLSYMLKTQASIKLKNNITIDVKLGIGVYDRHKETDFYELYDQHINTALSRIGLYWRDISAANKFMSCYFDIGSPMSLAVIDSLPYSIYAQLEDSEDAFNWFANALMVRLAVARSLPLTSNSFVAIGLKDVLYVQKTTDAEEDLELRGIENRMSAPIGIEYNVNTISVRLGVRFFYTLQSLRESTDEFVSAQSVSHDFDYAYSLGLGWKAGNRLLIDLYNTEDIAQVRSWAIYVKYLF